MRALATLTSIALATAGIAQDTVRQLESFAGQQLATTVAALDRAREEIASEKLPLAQELTALEERLGKLRRDHERVQLTVDNGNLGLANLKTEIKQHDDDLSYVANLLDEYVRTFETKVDVAELQYCGDAIEAAKQAAQNKTLSLTEKFDKQVALVDVSMKRANEVLGGMTFPGSAVNLLGEVLSGRFTMVGPVMLFGGPAGIAGLAVAQAGSKLPLVRPLEGDDQVGLDRLAQQGEGQLPVDPSRGGALKALVQRGSLIHIFQKGGPIMWPLLVLSIVAFGVAIERLLFLANERRKRDTRALGELFAAVAKNDIVTAIRIGNRTKFFVARALGYALAHSEGSLPNALLYSQAQEIKRFKRGIPILDTVITLAPLLGLLGTVTGMMGSFSLIGGELSSPGAITGGIAEALIATAFGLGIAITALLPFNFLNSRLDEASHEISSAATQLELLVQKNGTPQGEIGAMREPHDAVVA
jgi:biopolymer transport protein ExbB